MSGLEEVDEDDEDSRDTMNMDKLLAAGNKTMDTGDSEQ